VSVTSDQQQQQQQQHMQIQLGCENTKPTPKTDWTFAGSSAQE